MSRSILHDLPSSGLLSAERGAVFIVHNPSQIEISDTPPIVIETDSTHMLVRSLKIRREQESERTSQKRQADGKSGFSPASKKQAVGPTPGNRFSKRATRLQEAALQPVNANIPDSARRMRRKRKPEQQSSSSQSRIEHTDQRI